MKWTPIYDMARNAMDETLETGIRTQLYKAPRRYVVSPLRAIGLASAGEVIRAVLNGNNGTLWHLGCKNHLM
jgi:hypothetical protein